MFNHVSYADFAVIKTKALTIEAVFSGDTQFDTIYGILESGYSDRC